MSSQHKSNRFYAMCAILLKVLALMLVTSIFWTICDVIQQRDIQKDEIKPSFNQAVEATINSVFAPVLGFLLGLVWTKSKILFMHLEAINRGDYLKRIQKLKWILLINSAWTPICLTITDVYKIIWAPIIISLVIFTIYLLLIGYCILFSDTKEVV